MTEQEKELIFKYFDQSKNIIEFAEKIIEDIKSGIIIEAQKHIVTFGHSNGYQIRIISVELLKEAIEKARLANPNFDTR
jgi:hypothetical protein